MLFSLYIGVGSGRVGMAMPLPIIIRKLLSSIIHNTICQTSPYQKFHGPTNPHPKSTPLGPYDPSEIFDQILDIPRKLY